MSLLKDAIREWDLAVEIEAARLIEDGLPPFDAMELAVKTISAERRDRARQRVKGGVNEA